MMKERRQADVAEMCPPPRVTEAAARMGLNPGFALDLTVKREDDEPWDFNRSDHREDARGLLKETRPKLLIGSPACKAWSALQNLRNTDKEGLTRDRVRAAVYIYMCGTVQRTVDEWPAVPARTTSRGPIVAWGINQGA